MAEDAGSVYSEVRLKLDNLTHDVMTVGKKFQTLGQSMIAGVNRPSEQVRKSIEELTAKIQSSSRELAAMTKGNDAKTYFKELAKAVKDAEKANETETWAALVGEQEKAQALNREISQWKKLKAAMEDKQAAMQGGEEAARAASITKLADEYAAELERINRLSEAGMLSEQEKLQMIQGAQRKELDGLVQLEREYKEFGKEQEKIKKRIKEQAAAYKEVEAAAKKAGKGSSLQAAFNFAGINTGLGAVVDGVKAAARAAAQFIKEGTAAYREQEKAAARLSAVLKSTGADAWTSMGQLQDLARKQSEVTGRAATEIQEMQAVLLGFTSITGDVFEDTTEGLINMAAVMGGDLANTANQFGKALDTPAESLSALTRYGFKFTEQQKEQITAFEQAGKHAEAQRVILDSMKTAFGNAASEMNTAAASQNNFNTAVKNLKTEMGESFEKKAGPIRDLFTFIITKAGEAVKKINDARAALDNIKKNAAGEKVYEDGISGQIQQRMDFITQYEQEIQNLAHSTEAAFEDAGGPISQKIASYYKLIDLNREEIKQLEKQRAEEQKKAAEEAAKPPEEKTDAQEKADQEHASRLEAVKNLYITYNQAVAQAERDKVQAAQEAAGNIEALAAAQAAYAQAEAAARQAEINGLHSLSIEWNLREIKDAEAERAIENRLALQEGAITNARSMADITAKQAELETALTAAEEEYITALEQARARKEAGVVTAAELERAQADAAEERLRKLQEIEIQYRDAAEAAEQLERVRAATGGAQDAFGKERGEAENAEKIVRLTERYNDELIDVRHEKENIRRENEKELDYKKRLIDNEKQWALEALEGLDKQSEGYKELAAVIEQIAETKKAMLEDEEKGGGKSWIGFTKDDALRTLGDAQSLLSAAADWAVAETRRQVDEENRILDKKYKWNKKRIEDEKNDKLIAAGFEIANNEESLEAQLEAAKRTGDELLIYQAARALEKQRIEQEAAKAQKALTDQLEYDKAQLTYRAELQQWKWKMTMAAVNAAAAAVATFAQMGFTPPAFIAAGLGAAAAGAQIAAIDAAKPHPPEFPAFATGGIVPGTNYSGDKVIARLNSGEAVVTPEQQQNFMDLANGKGGGGRLNATIIVMLDRREVARSTVELINDGFYTIKARAVR